MTYIKQLLNSPVATVVFGLTAVAFLFALGHLGSWWATRGKPSKKKGVTISPYTGGAYADKDEVIESEMERIRKNPQ